jgi:hypothetical protein
LWAPTHVRQSDEGCYAVKCEHTQATHARVRVTRYNLATCDLRRCALASDSLSLFLCAAAFSPAVPSSAVQRIKGERCLRTGAGDLRTCTGAGESGFWEVRSHVRSRPSSLSTVSSLHPRRIHCKLSQYSMHFFYDDLVARSGVCLC